MNREEMRFNDKETPVSDEEMLVRDKEMKDRDEEMPVRDKETRFRDEEMQDRDEELSVRDEEMKISDKEMPVRGKETSVSDEELRVRGKEMHLSDEELKVSNKEIKPGDAVATITTREREVKAKKTRKINDCCKYASFTFKNNYRMSQFIIHAKDHTDAEALNRRLAARPSHIERMKEEKRNGIFILGGALLNDENTMTGSVILLSLPDEASVWAWIQKDVYSTHNVWNEVTVTPFRVADV